MKIIHFIPSWSLGGAENVVSELYSGVSRECQSTILTFSKSDNANYCENILILKGGRIQKYFSFLKYVCLHRPDVLHAHMTPSIPFLLILRIINWRIKLFYTVHGEYHKPNNLLLRLLDYLFYTKCNVRIVCVSEFAYKSIKLHWNIPSVVIYNGIPQVNVNPSDKVVEELKLYRKTDKTKLFLSVGRIVPVKNLELLIRAFNVFSETNDVRLIIVGYDPTHLQTEVTKLKGIANENVIFIGSRKNVLDYFILSDAFCMSSISESFGITILEAISCHTPVLSTPVGGIPELIFNNVTGLLSKDMTVESYVDMLETFLSLGINELDQIKEAAFDHYNNNFTTQIMVNKYLKLYHNES